MLVDFWATWCIPCLQEIPNIKQHYEKYRERGFEVVGINLDSKAEDLQRWLSVQRYPGVTVVSADTQRRGMLSSPMAIKCGVNFIPFTVLVGRDGRVVDVNVKAAALGAKLEELLDG